QGLEWIEDPSNQSNSFDRNFLRNEIVPGMVNRWPGMGRAIARSASHCAEASQTIETMAKMDLARVQRGDEETINIPALRELPGHRAKGVLRQWISDRNFRLPNTARLERVLTEVVTAAEDRQPVVAWDGAEIRRYRDNLYLMPPQPEVPEAYRLGWDGSSNLDLPFGIGHLVLREAAWGLSKTLLVQGGLEIRFNIQGVSCRPAGRSGTRTLKKIFQEYAVPNWLRSQTPLIYQGEDLVAVAGLCVCHDFATELGLEPVITR
ncbi:MAG: tRNA lysidine(34) synthetase TilS, partial [Gammaproteobacteria bacterium]|nr:tRNA lysidine(34) synthetase TilS [Gammaproteobacteria bacterium]